MQLQNHPAGEWQRAGTRSDRSTSSKRFDDRIRAAAQCWVVVAVIVYFFNLLQQTNLGLTNGTGRPLGDDFINYWSAAKLATLQRASEIYDMDAFNAFQETVVGATIEYFNYVGPIAFYHYSYSPAMILLTLPLAAMPYVPALGAWLIASFYAFYRSLRLRLPRGALLLALATPAVFFNAMAGQNAFWTAALVGGGLCLLERKPIVSGILFGLLIYKPHLALLIPVALLAGKQWQAFIAAAATVVVVLAASVLVFGFDLWSDHLRNASYLRQVIMEEGEGIWHRMVSVFFAARRLGAGVELAYAVQAVSALMAAAVVALAWARQAPASIRYSLLILGIWITTPYLLDYDLVACAFVVAWLSTQSAETPHISRSALVVSALILTVPIATVTIGKAIGLSIGAFFLLPAFLITAAMLPWARYLPRLARG
jgi:arabinofuranan 3-O-arabinosyltransferase